MREAAKSAQLGARVSRRGFPPAKVRKGPAEREGRASVRESDHPMHDQVKHSRAGQETDSSQNIPPGSIRGKAIDREVQGSRKPNDKGDLTPEEEKEHDHYMNLLTKQRSVYNRLSPEHDARARYLFAAKAGKRPK